jgi:Lrp/AsnC family transcriptional regulator
VADIAKQIGLGTSPCWRRIQFLEQHGIIDKHVALLRHQRISIGMIVFWQVKALKHDSICLKKFAVHVIKILQIVESFRMSDDYDYMLKVVVADMQAFDVFYKNR